MQTGIFTMIIMQEAFDFLKQHKEVAFATVSGNRPFIRVFQVMKIEGTTLYFATSPKKEVYGQLLENPNVEILGMDGNISVRMSGRIFFDVPMETQKEIYASNPILPDLYPTFDTLVYCRMVVTAIDYYDLTPRPPHIAHYDL